MATAAEKRAWLREAGYQVAEKGRLHPDLEAAFAAAHPGGNGTPAAAAAAAGPDYPDGMTEDEFADAELPESVAAELGADLDETSPRPPARRGAVGRRAGRGWRFGRDRGGQRRKSKAKKPRVSVEDVIAGGWRIMARVARPVPPLQRTLKVQAPVAGLLLEDAIKGTMVDKLLQPLARAQVQGKVIAALAGPPVLVTVISMHLAQCQQAGADPNPVFMSATSEMLRESLIIWMDVAGPKFEAALARERAFEQHYGQDVDAFMSWLFTPPPDPADDQAMAAEEEALRRAQGIPDPDPVPGTMVA